MLVIVLFSTTTSADLWRFYLCLFVFWCFVDSFISAVCLSFFRGIMGCDHPELFSLFVDNLPEDVGLNWFRKFFSQYGVVKDAYIPFKRSKVSKKRFGFVRYNCASSAEVAISKANGFWIDNRKLYVKMAAFEAQGFKFGHNGEN